MNLLAVLNCEKCGGDLRPVVVGKILSGREGNAMFECVECRAPVLVTVMVRPAFAELNCDLTNHVKAAHGTESGYSAHRRGGTPICEPCAVAHREGNSRRAQRRPTTV